MAILADRTGTGRPKSKAVDWVALWILVSAWCTLSGWLLSAPGWLNRWGYGGSLVILIAGLWLYREPLGLRGRIRPFHPRFWLPKIWLLLVVLAFVGGLLHHPNNYDYLSYRFARVLHWSWEAKWHWITTPNVRMNLAAPGFEWMMTPLFIFFKTDRLFFLVNTVSSLLLPGLIFSVFRRMGISPRVSWWWMWVLPSGYCFLLQAGSVSNDLFAAVYLLASLLYLLKTGEEPARAGRNFFYSCLALALTTGAKASNLPLLLPWAIAVFLQRKPLLRANPIVLAGALVLASSVSFFTPALLNTYYAGDYTGDPQNRMKMRLDNPVAGVIGNSIQIAVDNLTPTFWPKQVSLDHDLPEPLRAYLARTFPRFGLSIGEMQMEESAGVGVGIAACVVLMIALRLWAGLARPNLIRQVQLYYLPIALGTVVALLAFMSKLGNEGAARLLTPYYPLFIAGVLILLALDGSLMRLTLCNVVSCGVIALAVLLVILSPARPLFPTEWAAQCLAKVAPAQAQRLQTVYAVYGARYDDLKELRPLIPENETKIGLIQTGDSPESSLWRPFGSRQVVDVSPAQTVEELQAQHLRYIIVCDEAIIYTYHSTIDDLAAKWSAVVVAQKDVTTKAQRGPESWHILELP